MVSEYNSNENAIFLMTGIRLQGPSVKVYQNILV